MLLDEQKLNRHNYIGGSDVPIILGASKFKKPWDLLLEKAQIKEADFGGNIYSELGNILEPRIQNGLKLVNVDEITYSRIYEDVPFECHIDGLNDLQDEIQEIKVTNQSIEQCYESYHWQVRTYMYVVGLKKANLILLRRDGELKKIVSNIISEYNLNYIHDFANCDERDVNMAIEQLNKKISQLKLYPKMLKIAKISYDANMEDYFLKKVKIFWEYKLQLQEDTSLKDNHNFKKHFINDLNF